MFLFSSSFSEAHTQVRLFSRLGSYQRPPAHELNPEATCYQQSVSDIATPVCPHSVGLLKQQLWKYNRF